LSERLVGVESCVYLAGQLAELLGEDAPLLPQASQLVLDLRRPAYFTSVVRTLELEPALGLMAKVGLSVDTS
jgi:hypothetical protein